MDRSKNWHGQLEGGLKPEIIKLNVEVDGGRLVFSSYKFLPSYDRRFLWGQIMEDRSRWMAICE